MCEGVWECGGTRNRGEGQGASLSLSLSRAVGCWALPGGPGCANGPRQPGVNLGGEDWKGRSRPQNTQGPHKAHQAPPGPISAPPPPLHTRPPPLGDHHGPQSGRWQPEAPSPCPTQGPCPRASLWRCETLCPGRPPPGAAAGSRTGLASCRSAPCWAGPVPMHTHTYKHEHAGVVRTCCDTTLHVPTWFARAVV